jgi:Cytochrome c7 and related cytochrome c/Class III cytochrome C family
VGQIFHPSTNTISKLSIFGSVFILVSLVAALAAINESPYITEVGVARSQPVPFSHKHHVSGLGLDCRYCHAGVERSPVAGVPPTHTCMTCHSQLYTNAEMLAPVRLSLAENKPIHWNKVNKLPDYVYFDHSIHIAKGVGCTTCHGPVGQMPLMRAGAPLTMGWCLDCHRNPAPSLRPASAVFDPDWAPPGNQLEQGKALLAQYHIDNSHLTDCTVCHR